MGQGDRSALDGIRRAAATWVVRLSDPSCTSAERAAFEAWRSESFHNEAAYEQAAAAWDRFDRLRAVGAGERKVDPNVLAPPKPPLGRGLLKIAAGVVLALGLVGAGALVAMAPPAYATGVGERRVVALDDGSHVELNTDSKIVIQFRNNVREVRLVRGEALFQIAGDARPFVIIADDARLTTQRSEVAVRLREAGPVVQVSDGAVVVAQESGSAQGARTTDLAAGTEAVYGDAGAQVRTISTAEINRAQAWRQGAIALDGRSLEQAVEEFNRYNKQKLVLTDNGLAGIRLGGYFRTSDLQGFASALAKGFPVTATRANNGDIHLEPKT